MAPKKVRVEVRCQHCDKPVAVTPHRAKSFRFCSLKCVGLGMGQQNLGKFRAATTGDGKPGRILLGDVYGNWEIVAYAGRTGPEHSAHQWRYRCRNCGIEVVRGSRRIHKREGCKNCYLRPAGESGVRCLFKTYKRAARARSLDLTLTLDQFRGLTSAPCHYCGAAPGQVCHPNLNSWRTGPNLSKWGWYTHNGIDRKDNAEGYTPENCVPCCGVCNRAKQSMSYQDFVDYVRAFARNVQAGAVPCLSSPCSGL